MPARKPAKKVSAKKISGKKMPAKKMPPPRVADQPREVRRKCEGDSDGTPAGTLGSE